MSFFLSPYLGSYIKMISMIWEKGNDGEVTNAGGALDRAVAL
jgi:hypothetical protein